MASSGESMLFEGSTSDGLGCDLCTLVLLKTRSGTAVRCVTLSPRNQ